MTCTVYSSSPCPSSPGLLESCRLYFHSFGKHLSSKCYGPGIVPLNNFQIHTLPLYPTTPGSTVHGIACSHDWPNTSSQSCSHGVMKMSGRQLGTQESYLEVESMVTVRSITWQPLNLGDFSTAVLNTQIFLYAVISKT